MKTIFKVLGFVLLVPIAAILFLAERDIPLADLKPKYANAQSQFIPMMGMEVHIRDEGVQSDSLPIILLHGMSSSLNTWDQVVVNLKAQKRVISLDLPGFALTGPNPTNTYTFPYYNEFINQLTAKLGIKRFILAGNSLGGAIAWNYVVAHPTRVANLILIDAAGYPRKNESGSLGFKIASTPVINNLLLYVTPKMLVRASLKSIYADEKLVSDAQVERFHDIAIREGCREAALTMFKGSFKGDPKQIAQIKTPTLILWGDQDKVIDVSNADLFAKDIAGSQVEIYKNIGHVPMEEVPARVASSLLNFITPKGQ